MENIYFKANIGEPIFVKGYGTIKPNQRFSIESLKLNRPLGYGGYTKHSNTINEVLESGFAWFPVAGDLEIQIPMKVIKVIEVEITDYEE